MAEIIALFAIFNQHLSSTPLRQLGRVVFGVLAMTGRVTMRNISRWTPKGGSYRTVQRFFNTVIPWGTLCWLFFQEHLLRAESTYILAGDETVVPKSGQATYGLGRFFSSVDGKTVPGLSCLALSLVSVEDRRAYPMRIEQVLRAPSGVPAAGASAVSEAPPTKAGSQSSLDPPRGRPKGSRNKDKTQVVLSDTLKHLQRMIKALMADIAKTLSVKYLVLDGYFGHNNALQMAKQCEMSLISKMRGNAALSFPPTTAYPGRGRPRIYGERFNPREIPRQYCVSSQTTGNITTDIYQAELRSKSFADTLKVVCLLKTNNETHQKAHVLLFTDDLKMEAEKIIDLDALRFQIEFNFRDAKQFWGLADFRSVEETPVQNAINFSLFMVNVAAKLMQPFELEQPDFSVLDLKAHYRGLKYLQETLKMLPQKPEPIVIQQLTNHISTIGAIHQIPTQLNTS